MCGRAEGAEGRMPASLRGVSSRPWACNLAWALSKSLAVALRARSAEPSAAAGACVSSWWMRSWMSGAW